MEGAWLRTQIRKNFQWKIKGRKGAVSRLAENCLGMKVCNSRDAINSKYSNNRDASKQYQDKQQHARTPSKSSSRDASNIRETFYS
jgi:hypothetical protein